MARLTYGYCKNRLRCSLARNRESVIVPIDGRCPECGQPLATTMSFRSLRFLPALIVIAALVVGGYYAKTRFLDPRPPGPIPDPSAGPATSPGATPAPSPPFANPATGVVDKPTFDTTRSENAKARADVLERIDRMPNLTPAQKDKLRLSVDKARGMGCILIIPFQPGSTMLGAKEGDLLVKAIATPGIQRLVEDPTLVLVILGYADKRGDPQVNLKTSVARAEAVQTAMKERGKVLNVTYAVGMGGSDLFDAQNEARNRKVEVWAVFP